MVLSGAKALLTSASSYRCRSECAQLTTVAARHKAKRRRCRACVPGTPRRASASDAACGASFTGTILLRMWQAAGALDEIARRLANVTAGRNGCRDKLSQIKRLCIE